MTVRIPVYAPTLNGNEKKYVTECLDSTWISSKGEFIARFESEFARFIEAEYCLSVTNGTAALHLALEALGIGPGDEVIVPTLTYIASINTIAQAGATPVLVDSLRSTWQLDPAEVQRRITPRTKAVMAVHLYGQACDMASIAELTQERGLYLIEDCAEAIGTRFLGRHVGTFGDVATFSFYGNKTITTGEGGMVVSKIREVWERARHLRSQGLSSTREYWHDMPAYNYRMTNLCAAIGLAQLEQVDHFLARKKALATHYLESLHRLPLSFHTEERNTTHSYWMCSILVEDPTKRDSLRTHLAECGIETRPVFYPAHIMPAFRESCSYPIAESISDRGINLPSWPGMSDDMVNSVCQAVRSFFAENHNR